METVARTERVGGPRGAGDQRIAPEQDTNVPEGPGQPEGNPRPPEPVDPEAGVWTIRMKVNGIWTNKRVSWPGPADPEAGPLDVTPLAADFTGDGKDDLAIALVSGTWRFLPAPYVTPQSIYARTDDPTSNLLQQYGDIPLIYHSGATSPTGKRYAYPAYFRPISTYTNNRGRFCWYDHRASPKAEHCVAVGAPGDIPRIADTNGDGVDELLLFTPQTHSLRNVTLGTPLQVLGTTDSFIAVR